MSDTWDGKCSACEGGGRIIHKDGCSYVAKCNEERNALMKGMEPIVKNTAQGLPHCKVCWDAKAAEDQRELVLLRERLQDDGRRLTSAYKKITWLEDVVARYQQTAYHQALNSPDPAVDLGVPAPAASMNAAMSDSELAAYDAKRLAEVGQGTLGQSKQKAGLGPFQGGIGETSADSCATVRVCNKTLPGHPVELHEDEKACWKCGNREF